MRSYIGLMASIGCILLCLILLYWNPYSGTPPERGTVLILTVMVILPACLGVAASMFKLRALMIIVFIWSVPYCLYIAVASIPSIFNLFGVVLLGYLVSAIGMKRTPI